MHPRSCLAQLRRLRAESGKSPLIVEFVKDTLMLPADRTASWHVVLAMGLNDQESFGMLDAKTDGICVDDFLEQHPEIAMHGAELISLRVHLTATRRFTLLPPSRSPTSVMR